MRYVAYENFYNYDDVGLLGGRTDGQAGSAPNCSEGSYLFLMYGPTDLERTYTECIHMGLPTNDVMLHTRCSDKEYEYDQMFRSENGYQSPIPPHRPPIPNFPENGQLGKLGLRFCC